MSSLSRRAVVFVTSVPDRANRTSHLRDRAAGWRCHSALPMLADEYGQTTAFVHQHPLLRSKPRPRPGCWRLQRHRSLKLRCPCFVA
jgi:hypothetical protein